MQGAREKFLDNDQIFGAVGDILAAILLQNGYILDADAEFSGQIDTGLGGADRMDRHGIVVGGVGAGVLMG